MCWFKRDSSSSLRGVHLIGQIGKGLNFEAVGVIRDVRRDLSGRQFRKAGMDLDSAMTVQAHFPSKEGFEFGLISFSSNETIFPTQME
jgi:hypothetical protein